MSLALGAMFGGDEDAYEEAGFSEEQGWVAAQPADPVLRLRIDSLAAALEDTKDHCVMSVRTATAAPIILASVCPALPARPSANFGKCLSWL